MKRAPTRWTEEELAEQAAVSAASFRAERLAASDAWQAQYASAREKFDRLFAALGDLRSVSDQQLADAFSPGAR